MLFASCPTWRIVMQAIGNSLRFKLAAAALLLTGVAAAPVYAQVSMTDPDASVACGAFSHEAIVVSRFFTIVSKNCSVVIHG